MDDLPSSSALLSKRFKQGISWINWMCVHLFAKLVAGESQDSANISSQAIAEKDWITARQTILINENNVYMVTAGVILSSYVAALLLGAGWILSGTLLSRSPDLQVGQLLSKYPNASVPILIFSAVSVGYFHATTAIGYLYLENRLQLMWLEHRLRILAGVQPETDRLKASVVLRIYFAAPLATVCLLPPFLAAATILVRFPTWIQPIQAFSLPVSFIHGVVTVWFCGAIVQYILALFDILKRLKSYGQVLSEDKIH